MKGRLGVLLAGGRGRRLGLGFPKALLPLGGSTLLDRGIATLSAVCGTVVVVAPASVALPLDAALRVDDAPGAEGPLAGMVAGLLSHPFDQAVVLGVDFPLMRPETLVRILADLDGVSAVIPMPGGVPQPLAAAYGPAAVPVLVQALGGGERAPTRAMLRLRPRFLDDAAIAALPGGAEAFENLNLLDQLPAIEQRLAAGGQA
jgi:molybdenum cofactor guanylyltransferase